MIAAIIRLIVEVPIVIGIADASRADPVALLGTGSEAIQKGRWDDAIAVLSQAIAGGLSNPDLATAHTNRGYAYFGKGQMDQAITDYTAAIRLAPNDAEAHSLRGWAHFTKGAMKQAIADSTAAIRLDPNLAFAFRNRGRAQLYAGQPRPAVDDFATAVRLAPADALGVIWLHVARTRAGQADQQEFAANVAKIDRRTWPGPIADVLAGAITQDKLGDLALSAEGAKSKDEKVCDAQVYLGLLQVAAGDKNEAGKLFKAAVDDCPLGPAEVTEVAVAKMELKAIGMRGLAGTAVRGPASAGVAVPASNDAESHSQRASAHFAKGEIKQAIVDSNAAIRGDPGSAVAFQNRGRAQLYAGQPRPAADDFATAVRLAPADVLGVIWLHVARTRAGQADQQEFAANVAKIDRRTWPGPIADVLAGAITQDKLGDLALSAEGGKSKDEKVCDARVYLGLLQLAAGDKNEAGKLFKAAVDECPLGVAEATERAVAKMELKRLGPESARAAPKPKTPRPATAQ